MPLTTTAQTYLTSNHNLINTLGGSRGFGESTMGPNDDESIFIDLTSVFGADGINIGGLNYTGAYLNNNGLVYFTTGNSWNYLYIYGYDVDTRFGPTATTPGGTSTGSNLTWYDLDAANRTVTFTWDDVGRYWGDNSQPQAFQLQLIEGSAGEAVAVFRYEHVTFDYTTAGYYNYSNNYQYTDLFPGVPRAQLDTAMGTHGQPGVFVVDLRTLGAPTNQAPQAQADAASTGEDGSVVISVLANDTDPNGDALTLDSVNTAGLVGSVTVNPNQTVTYSPGSAFQHLRAGQTATTSFQYTVRDAGGLTSTATVHITIQGENDAPVVAGPVTGGATEGGSASTLQALARASDPDAGTSLFVTGVPTALPPGVSYDAANKTFTLDPSHAAYQSLAAGETTTVTVNYVVGDGLAGTPASVSWTVTGTNDAPVVSGAVTGSAGEDGAATSLNALAKASDPDAGATLAVVNVPSSLPAGVSYANGVFTLDPAHAAYQALAAGQATTVTVSYGISDGTATTPASVTWTVTGTNDAPVVSGAVAGAVSEDAASTLNALANASDPDAGATLSVVGVPADLPPGVSFANGAFTLDASHGSYQSLAAGQITTVTVSYGVSDGTATTPASVSWTVTGTNDAPVVTGAVAGAVSEDAVSTLNALANASDPDAGATLSVVGVPADLPPGVSFANGVFTLDASHAAYQSLAAGQTTTVTVSYGVSDGAATTPATVNWTVTGTNDAPVVSGAVTGAAAEDGAAATLNALANASDVDAGTVLQVVNLPATLPPGVTYDAATRSFTLNPADPAYQSLRAGVSTTVTVNYGVSDGTVTTAASASWIVTGTNDAPVATANSGAVSEDASVTLDVRANDTDADAGDTLTIVAVSPTARGGSVVITADGKLTYTADGDAFDLLVSGQSLTDTFTYTVRDGSGAESTATVSVQVNGAADGADINGGNRSQTLSGTALDEKISGGNAEDRLEGGDGADRLFGNNGKDELLGGQGRDQLSGGNGADKLDGGLGNDTLSGGEGPDTFVFSAGHDVVSDWDVDDVVRFAAGAFSSGSAALAAARQDGADVVIAVGTDSIRLVGVSLSSLTASDFVVG